MAAIKGRGGALAAGIGIAAATFGLLKTLHPFGPRVARTTNEIATAMSADPSVARFLPVLKQTFPNDYDTLLQTALANMKAGTPPAEAGQASFITMRALVRSHMADIARAPDANLLDLAGKERALLNSLDDRLCAKMFTGQLTPTDPLPDAARPLVSDVGADNLRAARAGIDHPTPRPATLQPADAVAMLGRMRAQPVDARQLAIYTGGTMLSASPHDQCVLGRASFASITELPTPQGGRITSFLISHSQ